MRRKIVYLTIIIVMLIGISNYSFASSFNLIVNSDKTEVSEGKEVTIELKLSNIDVGEKGINVLEGQLEYDNNFLENVTLTSDNNWKVMYNNEEGALKGKFLFDKMETGIKTEEKIGQIKVKVKDKVKAGETQIKIKGITSNDGQNLIEEEDKIVTLKINKNTDVVNQKRQNAKTGDNILLAVGVIIAVIIINIAIFILRKRQSK